MVLQALILDYGNVLSQPQDERWFEVMAAEIGTSEDPFRAAYWRHRPGYDAGMPAREYWGQVLDTLGAGPRGQADRRVIDRLIDADVASWTQYRDDVWTLAQVFRNDGGRTAFLSNGVPEAMARIRADRPLERWFDVVVVSCEVGVAKPDPMIFQIYLTRLGVEPSHALLVDDRIENVEGAARMGLRTFHFVGADAVSRLVRSLSA
jgi:putative hydrolase of the HAD superfamily